MNKRPSPATVRSAAETLTDGPCWAPSELLTHGALGGFVMQPWPLERQAALGARSACQACPLLGSVVPRASFRHEAPCCKFLE